VCKCPLDVWVFQEILVAVRPDIIIETGTGRGESAVFMACICDILQNGQVVNRRQGPLRPTRARQGDRPSWFVDRAGNTCGGREDRSPHPDSPTVMVLLDAAHDAEHVLEEFRIYHQLVSPGSYLIVEDTSVNSHPVEPGFGPGPTEAIETFLSENDAFFVDTDMEKFHLMFNPGGFLKRRGRAAGDATARLGRGLVADGPP
jgi:cephalosporin hydroxylase